MAGATQLGLGTPPLWAVVGGAIVFVVVTGLAPAGWLGDLTGLMQKGPGACRGLSAGGGAGIEPVARALGTFVMMPQFGNISIH